MFQSMTLPVADQLLMDANEARQLGSLLTTDFNSANPFPSIVLEDFLPQHVLERAINGFPAKSLDSDGVFQMGYAGLNKRQILPEDCGADARELFWFFNSRAMLQFLEGLSGIDGLLPDPYFGGGGYHETTHGGLLGIHADFRIHEALNLQRRLNLIVYLNPIWQDEWNGHLELWSRDMKQCALRIAPLVNRCVVFRTDADTWHGHPDALATPDGVSRKSIALYYYTASSAIRNEVPAHDTLYVPREGDPRSVRREARTLQRWEQLRDWVPPMLYRRLKNLQYRWRNRHR